MKEKQLFRFGDFRLCLDERSLRRGKEHIPLTPKMYDLLVVLVENHGRTLEKEFLLQSVWPDSFVEEGNITFNIRQLRKALGDDAQSPTYIETVPRRGYRFVADVEEVSDAARSVDGPAAAVHPVQTTSERHSRRYVLVASGAVVILLGSLALGGWLIRRSREGAAPILSAPFASEKLSTDGLVGLAALTPDGKHMVYTHRSGARHSLWVRQLDTASNTQIVPPGDFFYGGLCVSPDGNYIYFARGTHREQRLGIYRMPIFGGVPEMITDYTQGWHSVSRDGQRISFVRCPYTDDDYCSLYVADSADGKNEKKLITKPRPIRIGDNEFDPDGKTVAFAVGQSRNGSNDFRVATVDIETGEERELTSERFFNVNYISWLPDQSGALFTAQQIPDKYYRIWQVAASTGEVRKLTSDFQTYSRLSLDALGRVLVSTTVEPDYHLNIYQKDLAGAEPRILVNASTVTIAPDGQLIFSSVMSGNSEIWAIDQNGSGQRQLTNTQGDEIEPVVSPDGKYIYFESNRTGQIHIWRMERDGSNQTQLTYTEGGYPIAPSPDGRWLYYRSGLNRTIRRVPSDGGPEELVLDHIGDYPTISPDGSETAWVEYKNGEGTISVRTLPDGNVVKTFKLADPALDVFWLLWTSDGNNLAYILAASDVQTAYLWFQPLSGQPPERVADLSGEEIGEVSALAFAPDGRSFAVVKGKWNHNAVLLRGLK